MSKYIPPFSISNEMLNLVASIMEKIGQMNNYAYLDKMPILRRNNRIKSIHSSLAIEDNSLSLGQIKDIINGKLVLGPRKEIREVQNAYKAYEKIGNYNPYNISDLKKAHGYLTHLILNDSGEFRKGEEGVFSGDNCIFMAPPAERVLELMNNLFKWMEENKDDIHPLILSSIFHYEFVFIHPFSDGNGRCARLWQTVILSKYKDFFEYLPIESQIYKYQDEYYKAINECNKVGNSNNFILFMLKMIDEVMDEFLNSSKEMVISVNINVRKLLDVMNDGIPLSANEIMERLGIKSKETLRANYLEPAIQDGLIKMTIPDKLTSKNQRYYKV